MLGDSAGYRADGSLTDKPGDNGVDFPVQLRIVRVEQDKMVPLPSSPVLVEHDGRVYPLAALLQHLGPEPTLMLVAKSELPLCSGSRQLDRPILAGVFSLLDKL